ncbi:MAG: DUF3108 domain-containing protein, partial [Pyrinomonadaceae bacterium]|nr:DUF3108 domain-containing protein [Pyrinomonadaceae bacterium]
HVETIEVVNAALFPFNNDFVSYIDPTSGRPFRTQQFTREGTLAADVERDYNQPVGISAIPSRLTRDAVPGSFDPLSAIYRVRALPLTPKATYRLEVAFNGDTYRAELRVTGREIVRTNVGTFNAIATQIRARSQGVSNNFPMRVYFSDDERHIPVLIVIQHPAGEIQARLASSILPGGAPPNVTQNPSAIATVAPTPTVLTPPNSNVPAGATGTPPTSPANTSSENSNAETSSAVDPNLPFKVGEQLNYNVFLGGAAQPVGALSFLVRQRARYFGRDGLLLNGSAQTTGAGARLYPFNDRVNSYVDTRTLLPFRTDLAIEEGRRRVSRTVTVDQTGSVALLSDGQRINIPVGTHDLVSVIYALRSFNLSPSRRNAVSILAINRPRTLYITSLGRETIELGGQRIAAVQLSLTTDDAQPDRLGLRLWISEDSRRLPLRLTATTPLGVLRADLAVIPVSRQ